MKVTKDKVVEIHYTLTLDDGQVGDSTEGEAPLPYLHGAGNIIPGLEAALDGRDAGEKFSVTLTPEEGYGVYDEALVGGHGAYLLDEERPDVFTASIGNLPPGAEVLIRLTYVTELATEGDALRFTLPTTVSPRYAPHEDRVGIGRSPDAALNPPVAWRVPYGLDLTIALDLPGAITRVESHRTRLP